MEGMEPRLAITTPWPIPAGTSYYPEARSLSFLYIKDKKIYTGLHTHIHTVFASFFALFCFGARRTGAVSV